MCPTTLAMIMMIRKLSVGVRYRPRAGQLLLIGYQCGASRKMYARENCPSYFVHRMVMSCLLIAQTSSNQLLVRGNSKSSRWFKGYAWFFCINHATLVFRWYLPIWTCFQEHLPAAVVVGARFMTFASYASAQCCLAYVSAVRLEVLRCERAAALAFITLRVLFMTWVAGIMAFFIGGVGSVWVLLVMAACIWRHLIHTCSRKSESCRTPVIPSDRLTGGFNGFSCVDLATIPIK